MAKGKEKFIQEEDFSNGYAMLIYTDHVRLVRTADRTSVAWASLGGGAPLEKRSAATELIMAMWEDLADRELAGEPIQEATNPHGEA